MVPLLLNCLKPCFTFKKLNGNPQLLSSNPTRVCVCKNDIYNCNITQYDATAYPGETFQLPAVTVGQKFGTVPFRVQTKFIQSNSSSPPQIKPLQRTQNVTTNLTYTIMSSRQVEEMTLMVEKLDKLPVRYFIRNTNMKMLTDLDVYICLHPCPLGFVLYNSSSTITWK